MKNTHYITVFLFLLCIKTFCQNEVIPLWEESIPNFQKTEEKEIQEHQNILILKNVIKPNIAVYLPSKQLATGYGVIICPGGGYGVLAYDWEGTDIAKWLNSIGIAAFVLKYRLPNSKSVTVPYETPLLDAQRAIKTVRFHSEKWNLKKDQIGIMGFSAGGHLAATAGTHFHKQKTIENEGFDQISDRPDFMALIYPVITMKQKHTHIGSRNNLLGKNPDQKLVDYYSNELQVTQNTPPTFIIHSADDKIVSAANSLMMYNALLNQKVYAEMHLYPSGGHGYSLALGKGNLQTWTDRFYEWLQNLAKSNQ